jgi:hypothetical protein
MHSSPQLSEERLERAMDMLKEQSDKLRAQKKNLLTDIRLLVATGKRTEAKHKMRDVLMLDKRINMSFTLQQAMTQIKFELEDSRLIKYSINAMSDVARQFNAHGSNLDEFHSKIANAQDQFAEQFSQLTDLRSILSEPLSVQGIEDDDLEEQLNALESGDFVDITESYPVAPTSRPHIELAMEEPPKPQDAMNRVLMQFETS